MTRTRTPEQERADYAWLTPAEAAARLSCSQDLVRALIRDGTIPAINIGQSSRSRRYRIDPVELERFMANRKAQADGEAA